MIDIAKIAKIVGVEDEIELNSPPHPTVGKAPILDNGLNLLYAPQSYGKSYTAIAIAVESTLPALFIDLESNGEMFVNHCINNHVAYIYVGSAKNIMQTVVSLVQAIKDEYGKAFIIIDSYSDLFPNDEGKMAHEAQKQLGDMHKFFMREVELPILILDHATEQRNQDGEANGFKIEGNKSGKFKKTVNVLRLDKIDGNIEHGTFVTVERSRNQDKLPVGHTQSYSRDGYLTNKLQALIDEGKINEEFTATDLKSCMSGDDRKLWRATRDDIATSRKVDRRDYWKLTSEGEITLRGKKQFPPLRNQQNR